MIEPDGEGWEGWRVLPRLVGGAVSVPIVVGFVALGAAVLVVRSMREVVRETWALVPTLWPMPPQLPGRPENVRIAHRHDAGSHAA